MMYKMAKRLCEILSLPLTLHNTLAPKLKKNKAADPLTHKFDNAAPEVSIFATILMVAKMTSGLDGKERYFTKTFNARSSF